MSAGKTCVILVGGWHPFHAGHAALYQAAKKTFPNSDVWVGATNDTKTRPFPFEIKEKLARLSGVEPGHFVQVTNPFVAKEITNKYDPNKDVVVFVRSEKDRDSQPMPGGTKKDGSPSYLQLYNPKQKLQPFSKHAYMTYLPTVKFGPDITSASEIRNIWPTLTDKRKLAMVMSLYPVTQKNFKLANNVKGLLDAGMENKLTENNIVSEKLHYKKITDQSHIIEHAKIFSKNLNLFESIPKTSRNSHRVTSSFLLRENMLDMHKEIIDAIQSIDQFKNLNIKVGSKVAIINAQIQGDTCELWGFTNPKTITKIYREPSEDHIIQFEFNNDPDDIWPRTENIEVNGKLLMYSAFFADKKSAEQALTVLHLKFPNDITVRNHLSEDYSNGMSAKELRLTSHIQTCHELIDQLKDPNIPNIEKRHLVDQLQSHLRMVKELKSSVKSSESSNAVIAEAEDYLDENIKKIN